MSVWSPGFLPFVLPKQMLESSAHSLMGRWGGDSRPLGGFSDVLCPFLLRGATSPPISQISNLNFRQKMSIDPSWWVILYPSKYHVAMLKNSVHSSTAIMSKDRDGWEFSRWLSWAATVLTFMIGKALRVFLCYRIVTHYGNKQKEVSIAFFPIASRMFVSYFCLFICCVCIQV